MKTDRKKLVSRMILVAMVLFVLSGVAMLIESGYDMSQRGVTLGRKRDHRAKVAAQYQEYLDKTAIKIKTTTINPGILSEIQSEIFKKMPGTKLYLWMSDTKGEFIFGVPSPVFTRLNKGFDKYRQVIEKDGFYMDRNDFLVKLAVLHNKVKFSQFESGAVKSRFETDWRAPKANEIAGKSLVTLSSPVQDETGQVIGDLYLKVDSKNPKTSVFRERDFALEIFFNIVHVLFGFSAFFIWFLLPTWIYLDARGRDVKNIQVWIILTIISMGFAFIIYLITRPQEQKSFHCPECEKELNGTRAFCPYCGFDVSSTFCPQCQYPVQPNWHFCPNCRYDTRQEPQKEITPEKGEEK
ncbi:MAG: zinc ribbon domain-containing protein [bacterium]|nr:zinc ribbon domain-containing protein [bacterium]